MPFRIDTNKAALTAQRHLHQAQRKTQKSLARLASGSRIVDAGDDAAGFAISESLKGQLKGLRQAKRNTQSALSFVQTAEGTLNEQNNMLVRLRELAVQAASDTVGAKERGFLNKEFQQLVEEIDRIAKSTQFSHKKLLTGSGEHFTFQVGASSGRENTIDFTLNANTTKSGLGIGGHYVTNKEAAREALQGIDRALDKIAGIRAKFGAVQRRLHHTVGNLDVQSENISIANSKIRDVDVAREVTRLVENRIQQRMGVAVLAQANGDPNRVLQLLPT